MIVLCGALIALSAVLLVVGAIADELPLVYTSIGLSLVAGTLLLTRAVLVRRRPQAGRTVPSPAGRASPVPGWDDEDAVAVPPRAGSRPEPAPYEPPEEDSGALEDLLEQVDGEELLDEEDGLALVVVVPGRPRYHLDGCPELGDEPGVDLDVLDAREEGFTPCGTCRPDAGIVAEIAQEQAPASRAAARTRVESIVVVPSTGVFHRPTCPDAQSALDAQPADRDQAVDLGYRACSHCRP